MNKHVFRDCAMLLDIDGTLLDFAATPAGVLVPSSLQSDLLHLWKCFGGALALVSGRTLADIDAVFRPLDLPAIGGHGAEIRPRLADGVLAQPTPLLDERLRRTVMEMIPPGVLVEDKGYSIALHYRAVPDAGPKLRESVKTAIDAVHGGRYELLPGKCVIEIKPTGFNKGTAVLQLMEMQPFAGRIPIFIGDDVTDEAVFAVLPDLKGCGFSVGRHMPGATATFADPATVRSWLQQLASREPRG